MELILPGTRVKVFDFILYVNDKKTPKSITMKPATVVCRYGCKSELGWIYEDLVDVIFDHRKDRVSKGHFTLGVVII